MPLLDKDYDILIAWYFTIKVLPFTNTN